VLWEKRIEALPLIGSEDFPDLAVRVVEDFPETGAMSLEDRLDLSTLFGIELQLARQMFQRRPARASVTAPRAVGDNPSRKEPDRGAGYEAEGEDDQDEEYRPWTQRFLSRISHRSSPLRPTRRAGRWVARRLTRL